MCDPRPCGEHRRSVPAEHLFTRTARNLYHASADITCWSDDGVNRLSFRRQQRPCYELRSYSLNPPGHLLWDALFPQRLVLTDSGQSLRGTLGHGCPGILSGLAQRQTRGRQTVRRYLHLSGDIVLNEQSKHRHVLPAIYLVCPWHSHCPLRLCNGLLAKVKRSTRVRIIDRFCKRKHVVLIQGMSTTCLQNRSGRKALARSHNACGYSLSLL